MNLIFKLLINAAVVALSSYLLAGVHVANFWTAIIVAILMGVVNTFIRPILVILTLPITIFTLGLFLLVINTLMVLLVTSITPGFEVDSFWWALGFSILVSLVSSFLSLLDKPAEA